MKKYSIVIVLILIGSSLIAFPRFIQWKHKMEHNEQFMLYKKKKEEMTAKEKNSWRRQVQEYVDAQNSTQIDDPFAFMPNEQSTKKETSMKQYEPFAFLSLPKLKLNMPIYLSTSYEALSKGIGYVAGSSLPVGGTNRHAVLAGHRGEWQYEMFKNLDALEEGDVFYITTPVEKLTYVVYAVEVMTPEEAAEWSIERDRDIVTLVTCHPYGDNYERLLVRGERK